MALSSSPDGASSEIQALQLTPDNLESTLFKIPNEGEYFFDVKEIKLTQGETLPTPEEFTEARKYIQEVIQEMRNGKIEYQIIGGVAWAELPRKYNDAFAIKPFFGALVLLNPYFATMVQRSKITGQHFDKALLLETISSQHLNQYVGKFLIYDDVGENKREQVLSHGGLLALEFHNTIKNINLIIFDKISDNKIIPILREIVSNYLAKSTKVEMTPFCDFLIKRVMKLEESIDDKNSETSILIQRFLNFDQVKRRISYMRIFNGDNLVSKNPPRNTGLPDPSEIFNNPGAFSSDPLFSPRKLEKTTGNPDIDLFLSAFKDRFSHGNSGFLYLDRTYFDDFFENPKRDEIFTYLLKNKRDLALAILRDKVSHVKLEKLIKNLDNETIQELLKDGIVIPEFFTRALQDGDLKLRSEFMEQDQFSIVKAITLLTYDKQYEIVRNLSVDELTNLFLIIYFLSNEKYYTIKGARHICKRFQKYELRKVSEALNKAEEIKPGIKKVFRDANILDEDGNKKEKLSVKDLIGVDSIDFIKSFKRFSGFNRFSQVEKGLLHDLSGASQGILTFKSLYKRYYPDLDLDPVLSDLLNSISEIKKIVQIDFLLSFLKNFNYVKKIINELDNERLKDIFNCFVNPIYRLIGDYILFSRKPVNLKTLNTGNGGTVRGQLVYIEETDYDKVQLILMNLKPHQIPVLHDYPTTYSDISQKPVAVITALDSEYSHSSFFCDRNKIPLLHLGTIEVLESLNGVNVEINSDNGELKIMQSNSYTLPSPEITETIGTKTKGLEKSSLPNFFVGSEFYYYFLNTFYSKGEEVYYPYDYIKGLFLEFENWENVNELDKLSKSIQEFIDFITGTNGNSKEFILQRLKEKMGELGITYPIAFRSDGRLEDINGERDPGVKTSYLNIRNDDELWGAFINMMKNEFSVQELLNKQQKGIHPIFSTFGANIGKMLISEETEAKNILSGVAVFKDGVWKIRVCMGLNAGITSGKITTFDLQKNDKTQDFTQENYVTIDSENGGLKTLRDPKFISVNPDINNLIYSKLESFDGVESVEFSIRNFNLENPEFVVLQLN